MKKSLYLFLFGIAMAYAEAAVVVYLRTLYFPEGFHVASLDHIPLPIYWTEVGREVATIVMITSVSLLTFFRWKGRIGTFLFVFGLWDIFYYVFLYLFLRWPPSLLTRDVLFLIPVPWIAPVLLPVTIALGMVVVGFFLIIKSPS